MRKLAAAEYLVIERAAPFRSEFYAGEMFAMAGASPAHNRIKDNLIVSLGGALRGTDCCTLSSDQRVRVDATGLYTYPDVLVLCGPGEFAPDDADTLLNPKVIVEILSDSTEKYDRGVKFRHYQRISSCGEYVLIAQDEPLAERFVRQLGGDWLLTSVSGLGAELAFSSVPARVQLADLYVGVRFPEQPLR
jgi:Uma2 family endonuclease